MNKSLDSFRTKIDFTFNESFPLGDNKYKRTKIWFKCKKCHCSQLAVFDYPEGDVDVQISAKIICKDSDCGKTYSLEKYSNGQPFYNLFEE